jgi:hypothetical protein
MKLDANINDPVFAASAAAVMHQLMEVWLAGKQCSAASEP